jgi:hypothetical protein
MMVYLAYLEEKSATPASAALALLQRAMELDPTDDTRLRTGWAAMNAGKYSLAAETLKGVRAIPAGREFEVLYDTAYCSAKSNDFHAAVTWGIQAQRKARTPEEDEKVQNLLRFARPRVQSSALHAADIQKGKKNVPKQNNAMAF